MNFFTGSETIPPNLFQALITLNFKHGCETNCKCYPRVPTCAISISIPVRINNDDEMERTFIETLALAMEFGSLHNIENLLIAYFFFYLCTLTQYLEVVYEKVALKNYLVKGNPTFFVEQSFKPLADTLKLLNEFRRFTHMISYSLTFFIFLWVYFTFNCL